MVSYVHKNVLKTASIAFEIEKTSLYVLTTNVS